MAKEEPRKVSTKFTVEDLEYLWEVFYSHSLLHQKLIDQVNEMPWAARCQALREGNEGKEQAERTMSNIRKVINDIKDENQKSPCWPFQLIAPRRTDG